MFKDHISYVVFNTIGIPSDHVNLSISWSVNYNPSIDWRLWKITFLGKTKSIRRPQFKKPLFIGARAFVRSSKEITSFVIYATPTREETTSTASISEQYKDL